MLDKTWPLGGSSYDSGPITDRTPEPLQPPSAALVTGLPTPGSIRRGNPGIAWHASAPVRGFAPHLRYGTPSDRISYNPTDSHNGWYIAFRQVNRPRPRHLGRSTFEPRGIDRLVPVPMSRDERSPRRRRASVAWSRRRHRSCARADGHRQTRDDH